MKNISSSSLMLTLTLSMLSLSLPLSLMAYKKKPRTPKVIKVLQIAFLTSKADLKNKSLDTHADTLYKESNYVERTKREFGRKTEKFKTEQNNGKSDTKDRSNNNKNNPYFDWTNFSDSFDLNSFDSCDDVQEYYYDDREMASY